MVLWQICGSLSCGRDCHRIATETLGIFEKFAFCRGNKKNLQIVKFAGFKGFSEDFGCFCKL